LTTALTALTLSLSKWTSALSIGKDFSMEAENSEQEQTGLMVR